MRLDDVIANRCDLMVSDYCSEVETHCLVSHGGSLICGSYMISI